MTSTASVSPPRFSIRRLLLVEDNPADADLILDFLTPASLEVVRAASLAEARARLEDRPPDLVLLDLSLPDGRGLESVVRVRQSAEAIPIVVLTGLHDQDLAYACLAAGAQDYLFKNEIRSETLRRAIGFALARSSEALARERADEIERRMVTIVEASSDAIVSTSPSGRITSWNGGAEQIFGVSRIDALGREPREVIRTVDATAPPMPITGNAVEVTRLRADGTPVELSVVGFELRSAKGDPLGIAAICRDVTTVRQQARELLRRNEDLVDRDHQMRELTARMDSALEEERARISREVHDELGQLLTGLKMDLRWVGRRLEGPAELDRAALAGRVGQAVGLVDRTMVTVQRIALELRPSALDALGLASAVRDESRRFASRSGVAVGVRVAEGFEPPPEVATALFRVFQELLTNVARHARAHHVTVDLGVQPLGWTMRVEDDGEGLPAELRSRPSLGLLGMRERVGRLGGTMDLRNGADGGVQASVWVPRSGPERGADAARADRG